MECLPTWANAQSVSATASRSAELMSGTSILSVCSMLVNLTIVMGQRAVEAISSTILLKLCSVL